MVDNFAGPQSDALRMEKGQREEGMAKRNELSDYPKVTKLEVSLKSTALSRELENI